MPAKQKKKIRRTWLAVSIVTILAGISYCSWPLGYVLNPAVGSRGLASELEAVRQPYNWLFVLLDVASGVLVVLAAALIWRSMRGKRSRWLLGVLVSYAIFGVGTVADALLPMQCVPSLGRCPGVGSDPMLVVHGVASIAAAFFLFVSVMLVWYRHHNLGQSVFMSAVVSAWALFGIMSVAYFFVPGPGNLSQHYFITLCSFWLIVLPYTVGMSVRKNARLLKLAQPA